MKQIQFLLVLFFGFYGSIALAQDTEPKFLSIAGRIQDADSGEPLGGVRIINQTRNSEVLSKSNGFYSIVAAPGDVVRFSSIGFEPAYMKINETDNTKATVMIHLKPDAYYIEEVIVSLPSLNELNDYFMSLEVDDDMSRSLAEANPETFKILDNIEEPPPGGPVSFLKDAVFDKIKQKSKKPGRAKQLPKYKD